MHAVLALYFEEKSFIIIEEPERNIHPKLISKLINMMNDVSKRTNKQITITTHNPEIVKHSDLGNILLVDRNNECMSRIIKPSESDEVKTFLKNEIGVDELFVKDLLQ